MKNEQFCLGLCGQKQVGKDTVAEFVIPILSKEMFKDFSRVAFADAVKNTLCAFHYKDSKTHKQIRVTREFIESNKNSDIIPEGWECHVRGALCNIGDRFREINPEIWIDIAMLNNSKDKVITDVRYPNEAKKIQESSKGLVIKIIRPEFAESEGHRSEISMLKHDKYLPSKYEGPLSDKRMPYDYLLINDGSMDDLELKIRTKLIPFILDRWKYFSAGVNSGILDS